MNILGVALIGFSFVGVLVGSAISSFRFFDSWQDRRDEEKLIKPFATVEDENDNVLIEYYRSKQSIISPVETHEHICQCINCQAYNGVPVKSRLQRKKEMVEKRTPLSVVWHCYGCKLKNTHNTRPIYIRF